MPKEYELTDKEISKIVSNSYDADPWDSSESAAREAENAAQKKLAEHIYSKAKYTKVATGESFYAISEFDMHELKRDFGL